MWKWILFFYLLSLLGHLTGAGEQKTIARKVWLNFPAPSISPTAHITWYCFHGYEYQTNDFGFPLGSNFKEFHVDLLQMEWRRDGRIIQGIKSDLIHVSLTMYNISNTSIELYLHAPLSTIKIHETWKRLIISRLPWNTKCNIIKFFILPRLEN